ncbi:MAG: 4Fe-4S binding protein [Holophagales bacterium]|nr:MAG: 4Fe-4S binding protein [Holophagales bacterium]
MTRLANAHRISLPVVGQPGGIRRSRAGRWRAGVLIGVHVLILAHVAHWLVTGSTLTPVEPSEAMELGRRGVVNAGLVFFAVAGLSTLVVGRFACGWSCHLVALQDFCQWLLRKVGIRPMPLRSRLLAWVPTLAFAYMFLWPATYRLLRGLGFPALQNDFVTSEFWATFPGWAVALASIAICGFAIVYLLGAKGFCTYACPYGALFAGADRFAPWRIRVSDACDGCAHCTAVCTSNVRVHEEVRTHRMVVDAGCMKCLDCVSVCPRGALSLSFGRPAFFARAARWRSGALAWSEELVLAISFALCFFSVRGLYEAFPFLFSLGLAACFAFFSLVAWRLLGEGNVAVRRLQLLRAGRLQPAGRVFLLFFAMAVAFVAHSGAVQYWARIGSWHAGKVEGLWRVALAEASRPALGVGDRQRVELAYEHLDRARRWGLAPQPRLAFPLAWLAFLSDRPEALAARAAEAAPDRDAALAWRLVAHDARWRGRVEVAEQAYRRALDLGVDEATYLDLGSLLSLAGRYEEAATVFSRGRALLPKSAALAYNAALNRALEGKTGEAIAECREALALDPGLLPATQLLADLESR